MSTRTNRGRLYVANENYTTMIDGITQLVRKGMDLAREGHELIERNPEFWEPVDDKHVRFEVEQATANPGEKRGAASRATAGVGAEDKD